MRFVIDQCDRLPRGWGVAWYRLPLMQMVVLPIPLNLVVGAVWRAYWTLARGFRPAGPWWIWKRVAGRSRTTAIVIGVLFTLHAVWHVALFAVAAYLAWQGVG